MVPRPGCRICAKPSRKRSQDARHQGPPEEVVVVPGGKPIIFFAMLALVEEGDEVIYPNPRFPDLRVDDQLPGRESSADSAARRARFPARVNELASLINDRTKLIILNSPENPTGGVLTKGDIDDIAAAIGDRNIMVLSDEIYSRLLFEGEQFSIFVGQRHEGADDHPRRLLEDLCDDGMANGLRRDAGRSGDAYRAPDDQLELVHRDLHADRGDRSDSRRPE